VIMTGQGQLAEGSPVVIRVHEPPATPGARPAAPATGG
jgi:hypothetical protein